ncbi:MAG: hypothetical protein EBZ49_00750 [Proteobacteria bacterium]|nr:hypothetical protein [Pseudomonadota bacterium]
MGVVDSIKSFFKSSDEEKKLLAQNEEVLSQMMALAKSAQAPVEPDNSAGDMEGNLRRIRQESSGQ